MFRSHSITMLLAVSVILAGAAAPFVRPDVAGDTNGDSAVDVLDLQCAVAQLVGEEGDSARSDANGDGQLDTRDLQWLIQETQHGEDEAPGKLPEPADEAYVLTRVEVAAARESFCPQKAMDHFAGHMRAGEKIDTGYHGVQPRTERYYFNLTPHAPPSQA